MTRRRRRTRPGPRPAAAAVTLPDDDNILSEILLRLPPQPSSLPRASLLCKRWRRLVAEPHFRRRFRARHQSPPVIGIFEDHAGYPFFRSVMDPPDHIPTERFCPRFGDGKTNWDKWRIYGFRHGRVLLYNRKQKEIVVWDPLTGDHRVVAVPPEFDNEEKMIWNGAVLCAAAGNPSHVHGGFSSCPFTVVLVGVTSDHTRLFVCSYSSEAGNWSDLVSATIPFTVYCVSDPGTLVGNAVYWVPGGLGFSILKFNLDTHGLDVIEWPSGVTDVRRGFYEILLVEDVNLGLAIVSNDSLQIWKRKVCSECVTKWVLQKTHNLGKIHGMSPGTEIILGYAEDANVMLLWRVFGVYMLQLDSMQCTKLWETNHVYYGYHPYTTIYDSTGRSLFILQYNEKNAIACIWLLNTFYTATEMLAKNLKVPRTLSG